MKRYKVLRIGTVPCRAFIVFTPHVDRHFNSHHCRHVGVVEGVNSETYEYPAMSRYVA
jgi:hypothetical protein